MTHLTELFNVRD